MATIENESGKYWEKSWNPLKVKGGGWHCTKCSAGCEHCWAESYNRRFGNGIPYDNRKVEFVLDEKVLEQPLHRRKPTTYFVCDLCDLFHEQVPPECMLRVINVVGGCPQHTFLILTKRVKIMEVFFKEYYLIAEMVPKQFRTKTPYSNVHFGVTICTQKEADDILPIALQIPAAVRWISIEPMLGPIDLNKWIWGNRCSDLQCGDSTWDHYCQLGEQLLHWVVIGCESLAGGKAGRFQDGYKNAARSLIQQCKAAGVPVYHKQMPIGGKVIHNVNKFPQDLRVRELPG